MHKLDPNRYSEFIRNWHEIFERILNGDPDAWALLPHSQHTKQIGNAWRGLERTEAASSAICWEKGLSKREARRVQKSLQALVHLKDGRFCNLLTYLEGTIARHPNPFSVRLAFASAEASFSLAARESDTEEEAYARSVAFVDINLLQKAQRNGF